MASLSLYDWRYDRMNPASNTALGLIGSQKLPKEVVLKNNITRPLLVLPCRA